MNTLAGLWWGHGLQHTCLLDSTGYRPCGVCTTLYSIVVNLVGLRNKNDYIHCINPWLHAQKGQEQKRLWVSVAWGNMCYCCLNFFFFLSISLSLLVAAATLLMRGSSFTHNFRHELCGQHVGSASHALWASLQYFHQEASTVLSKRFCFSSARFPDTPHNNSNSYIPKRPFRHT